MTTTQSIHSAVEYAKIFNFKRENKGKKQGLQYVPDINMCDTVRSSDFQLLFVFLFDIFLFPFICKLYFLNKVTV